MSNDIVISAENVSKRYRLSHLAGQHTLRDTMHHTARLAWRRLRWNTRLSNEDFWALRDVDFEVKRGEVVGIIGRNGAGKSTLLKALSRITEPTTGRIRMRGRVASLLEVGTGFHPELTGRDNIFLNGAILGMKRAEIRGKFDEIVAFADVERFLDTPVKRYSSGMYVRLAFAVAAHLHPEILIVDEVLAVGDAEFQKKCLGRMKDVSRSGRTVLFVSHNLEALRTLCQQGVLLENGRVKKTGPILDVLGEYYQPQTEMSSVFASNPAKPSITRVSVNRERLNKGDLRVDIHFESPFALSTPIGGIIIAGPDGQPIFGTNMRLHPPPADALETRSGVLVLEIPQLSLHSSRYSLTAWLGDRLNDYDCKAEAVSFNFVSPHYYPNRPPLHVIGPVDLPCRWSHL